MIAEKQVTHLFNNVMQRLAFYNWSLILHQDSSEGYCWSKKRVIEVGMKYPDPRELLLHEIAHIGTARFCNQPHNPTFWNTFHDYMHCFLPEVAVSEAQLRHATYSTVGIYGLQYRRDI